MATVSEDVYCTLLMSDSYLPGAAVLAHSLRDAGTRKKLACLVTVDTLRRETIERLKSLYDYLIPVEHIRNPHPQNLYLMGRPDLAYAFTKIALWRQVQFRKIVYLDADVVALRALDELFDLDVDFAAAPDIGWPDAFNSGVMMLTPNMGDYWALRSMAEAGDSFDGADQGLLNQYYQHRNWHRLSFTYNCTPSAQYQWEPAYRYYKSNISAVHFIGKDKPWSSDQKSPGGPGTYTELLGRWWAVHDKHLKKDQTPSRSSNGVTSHWATTGETPSHNTPSTSHSSFSSSLTPAISITEPPPEATVTTTEPPLSEPGEPAENIDHGIVEPVSTPEQRKFSAPQMEWDATMFAPPTQSKPEAANFPHETYTFNESRKLFNAPRSYPEPPKDMWYSVPESKPTPAASPRPIFPWEQQAHRPKPTRVFADENSPIMSPVSETSTKTWTPTAQTHPSGGSGNQHGGQQHSHATPTSVNAWDAVPGIENYVRAIMDTHVRRAKPQVIYSAGDSEDVLAEANAPKSAHDRRASLILTDFPSSVERPSLPVTPAPRPRLVTAWGAEGGNGGVKGVVEAEGVPDQAEWDPEERLEQLRRSSLLEFEHLKSPEHPEPPRRKLPAHSVPGPGGYEGAAAPESFDSDSEMMMGESDEASAKGEGKERKESATAAARVVYGLDGVDERGEGENGKEKERPVFKDLDFGTGGMVMSDDVVSPSEAEADHGDASSSAVPLPGTEGK